MAVKKIVALKKKFVETEINLKKQAELLDLKFELFLRLKTLITEKEGFVINNIKDVEDSLDRVNNSTLKDLPVEEPCEVPTKKTVKKPVKKAAKKPVKKVIKKKSKEGMKRSR